MKRFEAQIEPRIQHHAEMDSDSSVTRLRTKLHSKNYEFNKKTIG